MQQKGVLWIGAVAVIALAAACGGGDQKPASPTSPSQSATGGNNTGPDGTTLKVNAPALVSPVGGARLTTQQVTVTFQAATGKYVQGLTYTYRVQLFDNGGKMLDEKVGTALSYTFPVQFTPDTLYKWKVRAEYQGQAGPWSVTETFKSMEKPSGYIRGNEIYDPLDDGKTVGTIVGAATWIPGKGLRLDSNASWLEYTLPTTLTGGEYSVILSNLRSDDAEVKTKVMAMREGEEDITTNQYRFTIEKRGNGVVAWRMITVEDQIDTVGAERGQYAFHEDIEYFWRATWGGAFNLEIYEGGVNGSRMYSFGKPYDGVYTPVPHKVFVGCPYSSRSGPQSVGGMIARQVWVSPNPRPSWAK